MTVHRYAAKQMKNNFTLKSMKFMFYIVHVITCSYLPSTMVTLINIITSLYKGYFIKLYNIFTVRPSKKEEKHGQICGLSNPQNTRKLNVQQIKMISLYNKNKDYRRSMCCVLQWPLPGRQCGAGQYMRSRGGHCGGRHTQQARDRR